MSSQDASQSKIEAKYDDNHPLSYIINKLNYPFIYCWITSAEIVGDATQFNFEFNLYIQHYNDLYHDQFKATWKTIKFLHNKAFFSHDREHFAKMKFPQIFPETNQHRNAQMVPDETELIMIISGLALIFQEYDDDKIDISIINLCLSYLYNKPQSLATETTLNLMDDIFMINSEIKTIKSFDNKIKSGYKCKEKGRLYSRAKFWNGTQQKATKHDNDAVSHFLCQIFNSPSFVIDDKSNYLFTQCGIKDNMRNILRAKAESTLNDLHALAIKDTFYSEKEHIYHILIEDKWRNIKFHTLYIVTRPTNRNKLSLLDHWALKFEGNEWLLTVEWLGSSTFYIKFLENTCLGQKVFWYSWSRTKKQTFTQRWGTLSKLYIDKTVNNHEITTQRIFVLLSEWLKYCKQFDPKYNRMVNNCQHFVRDFVSVFNENVADDLTTQFHDKQIEKIVTPSGGCLNDLREYSRIQKIKKILSDAMEYDPMEYEQKNNEVHHWLDQIGKVEHFDKFEAHGFDTLDKVKFIDITKNDDLKEMGIQQLYDRKFIMMEIKKLHFQHKK